MRRLAPIALLFVVACGIRLIGTEPAGTTADADAGEDATVTRDADVTDAAPPVPDADASGCPGTVAFADGGTLTAPSAAQPVTIDGKLSEWGCATFFTFDKTSATYTTGTMPAANVYSFAVAWDAQYVYVAAHVLDATTPRGDNTSAQIYENDAIEVYFGGDGVYDGGYSSKDHQYIVDWTNRAWMYQHTTNGNVPSGFQSAAVATSTGYDIELRVPASEMGKASLVANDSLGFAFAADEANDGGAAPHGFSIWYKPPIACGSCCEPSCSTSYYGSLVLAP